MAASGSGDTGRVRYDAVAGGTRFRVRVQPRASRTEIAGEFDGALRVRIAAPPVDNAANDELTRFLARRLGCARGDLRIVTGSTGRTKIIEIDGLDPAAVAARLA